MKKIIDAVKNALNRNKEESAEPPDGGQEEALEQEEGGEEGAYEKADALTGFNAAPVFNRQKTLMVIAVGFAALVMAGIIFSTQNSSRKKSSADAGRAAAGNRDFLRREMESSRASEAAPAEVEGAQREEAQTALPEVSQTRFETRVDPATGRFVQTPVEASPAAELRSEAAASYPPPPPGAPAYSGGSASPPFTAHMSPLVPLIERGGPTQGGAAQSKPQTYAEMFPYASSSPQTDPYAGLAAAQAAGASSYAGAGGGGGGGDYAQQNNQADKKAFYDSNTQGALNGGYFLGDNALWVGTIIPAVLETAVNTDLPGNITARVSQNIYDSRTGKKLLVPQGTLLQAKYNSSVSYAQKRIQIVWDFLTRPDGFALELDGMNAVDTKGRSGATAQYHENWFEYGKAAGIISMFSIANSKMTETTAKYAGSAEALGVANANAEFMNQAGSGFVSRAMNIQPTLTLDAGERLNVMLNKTVYMPPLDAYPPTQKYSLK